MILGVNGYVHKTAPQEGVGKLLDGELPNQVRDDQYGQFSENATDPIQATTTHGKRGSASRFLAPNFESSPRNS